MKVHFSILLIIVLFGCSTAVPIKNLLKLKDPNSMTGAMTPTTTTTTTTPTTSMTHDMQMGAGLTPQDTTNVADMFRSGALGTSSAIMANITINGYSVFAYSVLEMGLNHPKVFHVEHCRQVPYLRTPGERLDCISTSGWYYNVATRQCEQTSIPCNDFPTLNFWRTIDGCLANCTINGTGLSWLGAVKVNVDPTFICIEPPYNPNVSSPTCTPGKSTKDGGVMFWAYDATQQNCYRIRIDCHWAKTNNSFAFNSTCQHMCHDVTLPNSKGGHRQTTDGSSGNTTINGVSLFVVNEKGFGFKNLPANMAANDTAQCRQIPYYTSSSGKSKCVSASGFYYDVSSKKCLPTNIPCGATPSLNFYNTSDLCQTSCNPANIRFKQTGQNLDPRVVCIQPVYDPTLPWNPTCSLSSNIVNSVYTYDARRGVCSQVSVDCHAPLTNNVFTNSRSCSLFCNRISLPNMTQGIHMINASWTGWSWMNTPVTVTQA